MLDRTAQGRDRSPVSSTTAADVSSHDVSIPSISIPLLSNRHAPLQFVDEVLEEDDFVFLFRRFRGSFRRQHDHMAAVRRQIPGLIISEDQRTQLRNPDARLLWRE